MYYNASGRSIEAGDCTDEETFDLDRDFYGCCDNEPDSREGAGIMLNDELDVEGVVYVRISTFNPSDVCDRYRVDIFY